MSTPETQFFSHRLTGARNAKALTQSELAESIGVSLRSVQNWEAGAGQPGGKTLRSLSEVLCVPISFLLGGDDAAPSQVLRERQHPLTTEKPAGIQAECLAHLEAFLATCQGKPERLGWALEELRHRLPLNRWREVAGPSDAQINDAATGGLAQLGAKAALGELGLKQKVPSTSG